MTESRYRLYPVNIHQWCDFCRKEGNDAIQWEQQKRGGWKYKDPDLGMIFFGEFVMVPGVTSMVQVTGHGPEYIHKCDNCGKEIIFPKQYPCVENAEGRFVASPAELLEEDNIIKEMMKKHVGSAVLPGAVPSVLPPLPPSPAPVDEPKEKNDEDAR